MHKRAVFSDVGRSMTAMTSRELGITSPASSARPRRSGVTRTSACAGCATSSPPPAARRPSTTSCCASSRRTASPPRSRSCCWSRPSAPVRPVDRGGACRRLDARRVRHPQHHHGAVPQVPRRSRGPGRCRALARALRDARPVLRHRLDVERGRGGARRRRRLDLHAVRHAARRRGVEHAGLEPADGDVRRDRAGDGRGRARFRAARRHAQLHSRRR